MYLEDIQIGSEVTVENIVIEKEEMLDFANRYNPVKIHTDEDFAKKTRFGELIAPGMLSFLFTAGIVFGKMAGGFFGDRFGWMKTACVSLAGAALLFALAETSPVCGIAAVLLFNMTMPLTLSALALLYKDAVGLAFGMLTLALFLGTLPSMMSAAGWIPAGSFTLLPALSLLSAALMALGLSLFSRRRGDGA